MADLGASLALATGIVLLSEAARRTAKAFAKEDYALYIIEAVSTFQLCACTHEFKLLGETGRLEPQIGLTLTYVSTVVHILTFHGASCNPSGTLEGVYRKSFSARTAAKLIACQFIIAYVARHVAVNIWEFGLSEMHVKHKLYGYKCFDPINASVPAAAAVELACAFVLQAAIMHVHRFAEKLRVHVIALVITVLVYAAGSITGAVFNPALAFSIQFPCGGRSFLEYCFVYWLGPILGVASAVLFFERVIPHLSKKETHQNGLAYQNGLAEAPPPGKKTQ
ncbi:aquaporin-11 [Chanos chanos]|uniref:Aquaporin n=1 Tax=Chanos chanos TaxID=29144 RepID=A0A6J2WVC6_CHACN|nr:aquaporin-11-like [Chanos chanos]